MTGEITIRSGTPADLEQVIAIAQSSKTAAHWGSSEYGQIFQTKRFLFIAENQTEIVGFLVAHDIVGEWELENVVVQQRFQQRGIGQKLVDALVGAAEGNAASIFLEVRESNAAARKLYAKCGFQACGRRKDYYVDPREDAILYRFLCTSAALEKC